jgi:hypothetical protein
MTTVGTKNDGKSLFTKTTSNTSQAERLADEFVMSFGYQQYILTGLKKIIMYGSTNFTYPVIDILRSDSIGCLLAYIPVRLSLIIIRFPMMVMMEYMLNRNGLIYETIQDRYQRLITNSLAAINSEAVNDDIKAAFIKSVETMRKEINNTDFRSDYYFPAKVIGFIAKLMVTPLSKISEILTTSGMNNEIHEVLAALDEMEGNTLKYHAERMKELGK